MKNSKLYYDYGRKLARSCDAYNFVADRHDTVGLTFSAERKWTLSAEAYYSNDDMPFCDSVPSLLNSLRLGTRRFVDPNADQNYFDLQPPASVFVPHGCRYAWFSPLQCCELLEQFSRILFVGDSLVRHMLLASHIIVSGNFEYGGLPAMSTKVLYDDCRCDGQFSEHAWCRVMPDFDDNRKVGLCNSKTTFQFKFVSVWQPVGRGSFGVMCRADDTRRTVAILSGGSHYHMDAAETLAAMLRPTVDEIRSQCRDSIIVWMTLGNQHRKLDVLFPHQAANVTRLFNAQISAELKKLDIYELDVWNLTKDAQTADGFHQLTETNVIKSMYLMNLIHQLSKK